MSLFTRKNHFVFPGPTDRVAIVGKTGSGKSVFALWLFSESADFDKKPWTFIDYKQADDTFKILLEREDAALIKVDADPPTRPGIYILQPNPHETELVSQWLWKAWKRGKIGLVFDELYMVPEFRGTAGTGGPLKSILTQGRAKEIPVYGLSQRPVDVNLHMFSEAEFISEFKLKRKADRERVQDYLPDDNKVFAKNETLPPHWSKWYDDRREVGLILRPAPHPDFILDTIAHRVAKMREHHKV